MSKNKLISHIFSKEDYSICIQQRIIEVYLTEFFDVSKKTKSDFVLITAENDDDISIQYLKIDEMIDYGDFNLIMQEHINNNKENGDLIISFLSDTGWYTLYNYTKPNLLTKWWKRISFSFLSLFKKSYS